MASKARQLAQSASAPEGRRNLLFNGAMQVAQRGTSLTGQTAINDIFTVDRFNTEISGPTSFDIARVTDSPDEFSYSQKVTINGSFSASASHYVIPFEQRLEGQDLQQLMYGTSSAKSFTLSFHIKSTKTGTYVVEAYHVATDSTVRRQAQSYTINSANTWEKKTITFSGDTAKDIANDNGNRFGVFWWVASGSTFTSGTLATSWENSNNANRAVGVTSSLADDDSFQIVGVQVEVGSVATEFEHRGFGEELALCQRYYHRQVRTDTTDASDASRFNNTAGLYLGVSQITGTTTGFLPVSMPTTMRTTPTISQTEVPDISVFPGSNIVLTAFSIVGHEMHNLIFVSLAFASGGTANDAARVFINTVGSFVDFDAEL